MTVPAPKPVEPAVHRPATQRAAGGDVDIRHRRSSRGGPGRSRAVARGAWQFDDFALRLGYLVIFALACLAPAQQDTFWLLRAGRDFWHTGHVQFQDHYTYTAEGRYWPNHEWLWEVLAYVVHATGGMPLLTLVDAILFTAAVFVAARLSERRGYGRFVVVMTAIPLLVGDASQRPQITSLFLFSLTLLLVARERYALLVPLFLLWANLHAGVASGGFVLVAASLVSLCHAVAIRTAESRRRARRVITATACAGAITLINPMGIGLWTYVIDSHARSKRNQVQEWVSPFHQLRLDSICFFIVVAIAIVVACRRWRRLDSWAVVVPAVSALVLLPLALDAVRNIALVELALMSPLIELIAAGTHRSSSTIARPRTALAIVTVASASLIVLAWAAPASRLGWKPMNPADMAQLTRCPGRVYTSYGTGGDVEWFTPDVKTFVDSRQDPFPPTLLDTARSIDLSGRFESTFARYRIQCAVVLKGTPIAEALGKAGWRVGKGTANTVVYLRSQ